MANKHKKKMLYFLSHQENANESHREAFFTQL